MIAAVDLDQLFTLVLVALALGLDAFSFGIGIGLKGIRLLDVLKISIIIGIFHVFMPLIGFYTGHYFSTLFGNIANTAGGLLLILLGLHMVYSAVRGESAHIIDHQSFLGLILFAGLVSMDSFSVGVSLGLFASDLMLAVLLFGAFGSGLSVIGLMLGRKFSGWVGGYSEAIAGLILFAFGLKFLL